MPTESPIGSATVSGLLAAIASDQPAPGAGAAGAVALALGLACARKAVRISGRHHPADALLPAVSERLAALTDEVMERGQEDARRFTALVKAMRLPDADASQAAARDTAMADAEAAVRSNTARLIAMCDEAAAEIDAAAEHADPVMAGDIAAARALVAAARAIHAANLAESDHGETSV